MACLLLAKRISLLLALNSAQRRVALTLFSRCWDKLWLKYPTVGTTACRSLTVIFLVIAACLRVRDSRLVDMCSSSSSSSSVFPPWRRNWLPVTTFPGFQSDAADAGVGPAPSVPCSCLLPSSSLLYLSFISPLSLLYLSSPLFSSPLCFLNAQHMIVQTFALYNN